jgi:hypothetical protein
MNYFNSFSVAAKDLSADFLFYLKSFYKQYLSKNWLQRSGGFKALYVFMI